jgi:uncharacterized metal-binding protein YceD (DUF177 family)
MKKEVILADPFDLSKIDTNRMEISFIASTDECARIREILGVDALHSLEGYATIKPWHKTGFMLEGTLEASVEQICVVSLEPVPEAICEPFQRTFLPPREAEQEEPDENVIAEFVLESEDPPDILRGHTLDLLTIISEHLALGLDAYPRKPGIEIDPAYRSDVEEHGPDDKPNPFAVLKQLKE